MSGALAVSLTSATKLPGAGTLAVGAAVALVVIAVLVLVMRARRDAFPLSLIHI